MTLREQVSQMVGEGEELKPEDFSNLILDELKITQFSEDDKKFLEEFTTLELLASEEGARHVWSFALRAVKLGLEIDVGGAPREA